MKSLMRVVGALAVAAGLFWLGRAYLSETTVKTESGNVVHNLGLMAERQNGMIVGGVIAGVGCAIFLAGEMGAKANS